MATKVEAIDLEEIPSRFDRLRDGAWFEVRPQRNGTGRWIQVSSDRAGYLAVLRNNTYFHPDGPLSKRRVSYLRDTGWDVKPADMMEPAAAVASRRWRRSEGAVASGSVLEAVPRLFSEVPEEIESRFTRRNRRLLPSPSFPHWIFTWDRSDPPLFGVIDRALEHLQALGVEDAGIFDLNDGSSEEIIVVAPRSVGIVTAADLWWWCLSEWPHLGADVSWVPPGWAQ